jgi:hypothetical protein
LLGVIWLGSYWLLFNSGFDGGLFSSYGLGFDYRLFGNLTFGGLLLFERHLSIHGKVLVPVFGVVFVSIVF